MARSLREIKRVSSWIKTHRLALLIGLIFLAISAHATYLGITILVAVTQGRPSEMVFGYITVHRLMSPGSLSAIEKFWLMINILGAAVVYMTIKRKRPTGARYFELLLTLGLTWNALSFDMTSSASANYIILAGAIYLLAGAVGEVYGHVLQTWRSSSLAYMLLGKHGS